MRDNALGLDIDSAFICHRRDQRGEKVVGLALLGNQVTQKRSQVPINVRISPARQQQSTHTKTLGSPFNVLCERRLLIFVQ